MNNRLDYIGKFRDGAREEMESIRKAIGEIDEKLRLISHATCSSFTALHRAISIARTKLESAQMYAIKAVCLQYEDASNDS